MHIHYNVAKDGVAFHTVIDPYCCAELTRVLNTLKSLRGLI